MDELQKKTTPEYRDYCCGTTFDSTQNKKLRCVGDGCMSWVDNDWVQGDRPNPPLYICQCRKMSLGERRKMWVSKYLGDCTGNSIKNIIDMYSQHKSFYIQTNGNINPTIINIVGIAQSKTLKVTGYDDTTFAIGDRYENGQYFLPYECLWICMDAERIEQSEKVSKHLNELIYKSSFGSIGIIITGSEPWQEFVRKHNIGRTMFHNIVAEIKYERKNNKITLEILQF